MANSNVVVIRLSGSVSRGTSVSRPWRTPTGARRLSSNARVGEIAGTADAAEVRRLRAVDASNTVFEVVLIFRVDGRNVGGGRNAELAGPPNRLVLL